MKRSDLKIQPNELSENAKVSMRTRVIFGVLFAIPLGVCLFLGDWFFLTFTTAVLFFACHELLGVIDKRKPIAYILLFVALALIVYWPIFGGLFEKTERSWHIYVYFIQPKLPILVLMIGIFLLFLLVVIYPDVTVRDACLLSTIGVLIAFGLQCMLFLRFYPLAVLQKPYEPMFYFDYNNTVRTSLLIIYTFLGTFATDAGAYFVGVLFGKHKMNERISPKKTWEGFVGGIVISFAISFAFGMILAANNVEMIEKFDMAHWYNILILSLIIPLVATLGDFVFSSIKRYYSIKDFGNLIPGHGGVLDRFDSLIFVFIVSTVYVYIAITHNPIF